MTNEQLIFDTDTKLESVRYTTLVAIDLSELIKAYAKINESYFKVYDTFIESELLEYIDLLMESLLFVKSKGITEDILIYRSRLVEDVAINVIHRQNKYYIILDTLIDF